MTLPLYVDLDKYLNALDRDYIGCYKKLMRYLNSAYTKGSDRDWFYLKGINTGVSKIRITCRNNLVANLPDNKIYGKKEYWEASDIVNSHLEFLIRFSLSLPFFKEIGRVMLIFSLDESKQETPEHTDYDDAYYVQEFVLIRFGNNKRFYIKNTTGTKQYLKSKCSWFDARLPHGTEGSAFPSISLRVDGEFTDDFHQIIFRKKRDEMEF